MPIIKYGCKSTHFVAICDDSRSNSSTTGTSLFLTTTKPLADSTLNVSQRGSAPRCMRWPERLVIFTASLHGFVRQELVLVQRQTPR